MYSCSTSKTRITYKLLSFILEDKDKYTSRPGGSSSEEGDDDDDDGSGKAGK